MPQWYILKLTTHVSSLFIIFNYLPKFVMDIYLPFNYVIFFQIKMFFEL